MAQTNTLPARTNDQPVTLRQRLIQMTPEFKKALPGHIPVERFVRTVQTALQMNPQVSRAATATEGGMHSLLAACTKAATDGLILDGREAALVTFRQKVSRRGEPDRWEDRVQYLPMVAGIMKMARNSGAISSIAAHVVYENDKFAYVLGDDERIEHEPLLTGPRGQPVAVYAIVRLKDGSVQREVMDKAAIMRIAAQSKNPDQYDPAKGKNYGEWWRKTVIRRISKYLPSSSDRDEFMDAVERIDDDFEWDQRPETEIAEAVRQRAAKKRGGAAAVLKDVTPTKQPEPRQIEREPGDETYYDPETGEIIDHADDDQQPGDDI
jgi:recombination protein RecT